MKKRLLKSIPVISDNATHIDIELYYNIGGINYFTGGVEQRGLYLSVTPCKKSFDAITGRVSSVSYTAFSGVKSLVKELNRFNQKTLDTFVVDDAIEQKLLNHVIAKNNITIPQTVE